MSESLSHLPRELHRHTSAGPSWPPADGRTWVTVRDARTDATLVRPVPAGERARDVFAHPSAYAARRGVPTTAQAA
jgi:hypothetical protein